MNLSPRLSRLAPWSIAAALLILGAGCVEDYNPNAFGTPPGSNNGATSTNNATTSTNNSTTSTNNAITSTSNGTTGTTGTTTAPGDPELLGLWREDAQRDCSFDPPAWFSAKTIIQELAFYEDNTFQLTWFAFETYVDYWGTYAADPAAQTMVMRVTDGNYIPTDLDLEGTYRINDRGRLELYDMWLGAPENGERTIECGHRFEPY